MAEAAEVGGAVAVAAEAGRATSRVPQVQLQLRVQSIPRHSTTGPDRLISSPLQFKSFQSCLLIQVKKTEVLLFKIYVISNPLSGFPASPDLGDPSPHIEPGLLSKPVALGQPDLSKFSPSPSIIKHTDPRVTPGPPSLIQRQPQPGSGPGVMVNNSKIQRRPSANQLPPSPGMTQGGHSPGNNSGISRSIAAGQPGQAQSVISQVRRSVDGSPDAAAFIQQRRTSGGMPPLQPQQQQQRTQQLVVNNGNINHLLSPSVANPGSQRNIVHNSIQQQHTVRLPQSAIQQHPELQRLPPEVLQQQQQQQISISRPPQAVLQHSIRPSQTVLQQQHQPSIVRSPPTLGQQQVLPGRVSSLVLQQQQPVARAQSPTAAALLQQQQQHMLGGRSPRGPGGVQGMPRLPTQPVTRPGPTVLQATSRPPPGVLQQSSAPRQTSRPPPSVMSAIAGPRPISLQSRNDQTNVMRYDELVIMIFFCMHAKLPFFSVPLRLPTQPLPPPPALQQVVPTPVQTNKPNLDVLAHTLKLADLDFDFEPAEPVRGGGGSSLVPPSETQVVS